MNGNAFWRSMESPLIHIDGIIREHLGQDASGEWILKSHELLEEIIKAHK